MSGSGRQGVPPAPNSGGAGFKGVQALVQAMQGGQVGALLVLGAAEPGVHAANGYGLHGGDAEGAVCGRADAV